ncbi:MAG: hypothetical protein JJT95_14250 [Pararhodobacter sp.]|nr:hypothetical protein [Pararhodobacter sp.]
MSPQAPRPNRPHPNRLPGEHDSRAGAMLFWPVHLRQWLGLPGLAGAVLAPVVLATLLALEHTGGLGAVLAAPDPTALGRALFFAFSLALLVEFAAHIPLAAQRDLDALAGELTLDATEQARLRAALIRQDGGLTALYALLGATLGLAHAWAGVGLTAAPGVALGTVLLWSLMVQTGLQLVSNAQLFAALGAHASQPDPLAPDRLYPFVRAALRPMLLIMSLLAAYPLMLLATPGWSADTLIGPAATLALALAAVWFPLRGLAGGIRQARDRALGRVDAAIAQGWAGLERDAAAAARLEALLALRDRLKRAPSLPLALPGLARAMAYLALPIATWSGKGLGEAVLNRLFGGGG